MWDATLFSRFVWSIKLFGRTIMVQLVVGLVVLVLGIICGILAPVAPALIVFVMVVGYLLFVSWMIQVLMAAFAHCMSTDESPPLKTTLRGGLGRLPVMGNAMLLVMLIFAPLGLAVSLLGQIHPLVSFIGMLVIWWFSLRLYTLAGVVAMEDVGPWQAIKRSWQLSSGFVLRMLGNALFLALIFVVLMLILVGISWLTGLSGVTQQMSAMANSAVAAGGPAADPMSMLFGMGSAAWLPFGILIVGGLLLEVLISVLMMAYSFFFYVEQKMAHDGGTPKWQPAGMADRKQWVLYLALVGLLALAPSLAVALAPPTVENEPARAISQAPQSTSPKTTPAVKLAPVVRSEVAKREGAKPADKVVAVAKNTAVTAAQSGVSEDEQIPESNAHLVKAPELDIAKMRDPFESYLTVLDQQSKQRMEQHRGSGADHDPEPLEAFDLGALRLVAIMQMGSNKAAMVEDPEGKGYVVRAGSYIGRDNGRIENITARSVEIMEDEFTATGEIVKRKAVLTLNEVNQ